MSLRSRSVQLASWGRFPVAATEVLRPARQADLAALVGESPYMTLIGRGYGRSYGDAALNTGGGVVEQIRLDRLLAFDESTGVLVAEAGVRLKDILDVFAPRGWFLPVTPGTKYVSLGGALACDIHGKNHHCDASFSNHVEWFELLTADGSVRRCSKTEHADLFWATAGGMGLTGFVLTVALKLRRIETAYIGVDYVRTRDLDETLERCEAEDHRYRYAVCWIDCLARGKHLGRSVLMRGDHLTVEDLPAGLRSRPLALPRKREIAVPFSFPNGVINPLTVKAFNTVFYHKHPRFKSGVVVDFDSYFYPLDAVLEWNRVYGRRGFIQYQPVLPLETSRTTLVKILEVLGRAKIASFLAVLKRFGPQDGLLSFPMPGYTLALDIPMTGAHPPAVLDDLDELVVQAGGRIYLGKDARLKPRYLEAMYPRLAEWRRIKQAVDPQGLFSSDLSRRVGLTPVG
ncbi:MAG: FAD-binding oxidoreductase [Chloracidobacterium sp.]|nr:FAD-binding oxidoreductase [Chloracidobacterium sp.]MDW8218797.1 FAD-binding oxidoreductase [Acidobacteriota bacterium]